MIGRDIQVKFMKGLLTKKKSSFLAVTGRRRVGKTYLIDQTYEKHICLRVTGIQDGDMATQMRNFTEKIAEYSGQPIVTIPQTWQEIMILLKNYLQTLSKRKKQVIFLDELPWIATKRSGFTQLLAHLWNDYLSKENHFVLVICGSATSWITKKIVNDRGGFHNRITDRIRLRPFTLAETKAFLRSKKIRYTDQAISELYMIMGGIPYYLELIPPGQSVSQVVIQLCFSETGPLRTEYDNLYKALFDHPENHEAIVATLAKAHGGLTRAEILAKSSVAAGGPYTRAMEDLTISGFVEEVAPYGKKKRGAVYRLTDEYSIFYHKFIHPNRSKKQVAWSAIQSSQKYKIWTGFAFEALCHRHIPQIKRALGISDVITEQYSYRQAGSEHKKGYQIDLILDRNDQVINLCECKYYNDKLTITKDYARKLRTRRTAFQQTTKTKKTIFNTLITSYGSHKNAHYLDVIDKEITINDLLS